jgi:uncharacterized protein (DUF1330 family)
MAELSKVQINDQTESEKITLEQQAEAQEKAKQEVEVERPEWLDEKFTSPEELAKAYNELQQKQGAQDEQQDEETEEEATDESQETNSIVGQAQEMYAEKGELSDKMYRELEKSGLPKELVDTYIAGQEALIDAETQAVKEVVGGAQNYEAMVEWAQENLTDADINAYDDVVSNGTVEQAQMAVQGMYARFLSGGGKAPNLMQGSTSGEAIKPFNSSAQVTEAMRDKRYTTDPAFRANVEKRLSVTTAF